MVQSEFWRQKHESMNPTCLVSTVQAAGGGDGGGGVMVRAMLSWHTSKLASLHGHNLKRTRQRAQCASMVSPVTKSESNSTSLGYSRMGDS